MEAAADDGTGGRRSPRRWLLLRGLGREQRHWFDFPELLASSLGARTETVDLPGMGSRRLERSPCSIAGIARDLQRHITPAHREGPWGVLGISLGGMVALELAARSPREISHVAIINCSSRLSLNHQRLRPHALVALVCSNLTRHAEARERCIYALTTRAPRQQLHEWSRRAAAFEPPAPRALLAQLLAARAFRPPTVNQPVLVLSGARDRVAAPACSRALAQRLGATHYTHPRGGHDLPIEQPQWVAEQLRLWLASIAPLSLG